MSRAADLSAARGGEFVEMKEVLENIHCKTPESCSLIAGEEEEVPLAFRGRRPKEDVREFVVDEQGQVTVETRDKSMDINDVLSKTLAQ